MGSLIKLDDGKLIQVLHEDKDEELPKPFENEIFLMKTYVAKVQTIEGIDELAALLEQDEMVSLYREGDKDKQTVVVRTTSGAKLGYLPLHDQGIIANLLDAGKRVYGKIDYVDENMYQGSVLIDLNLYMKE